MGPPKLETAQFLKVFLATSPNQGPDSNAPCSLEPDQRLLQWQRCPNDLAKARSNWTIFLATDN